MGDDRDDLAAQAAWTTCALALGYMALVSLLYVGAPDVLLARCAFEAVADDWIRWARAAGHDVSVLDLCFARDPRRSVRQVVLRRPPDVIGISVRNIDNSDSVALRRIERVEKIQRVAR